MKEKWLPHGITAGVLVVFIVLGLACASSQSPQFRPPDGMKFGEREPLLAGTTWQNQKGTQIYQFKADGGLIISGFPDGGNWSRDGDSVIFYLSKEGDRYWVRFNGTYDAPTQTMWGTSENSDGSSGSFTFTKYTGVSPQAAPAASPGASASSAPSSRAFFVTVWYTSSGTRLSSVYTVEAASKDEAEREAERQWKTQFGWNQAMQFQEAVANW